jgi:type II secretory pathway component PulF
VARHCHTHSTPRAFSLLCNVKPWPPVNEGGQLSFILFSLADAIDQRELRQSADWAEMLKPFVVVVSGLVTGFIVFAMFVPLVKLISRLS